MAWPTLTDALIRTEVRTLLGEPTPRDVSDDQLDRYINEAVSLISKRNLATGAESSFALIANQFEYLLATTLMTDAIAVRDVIFTASATEANPGATSKALLKMHPRHFANIRKSTAGDPQEWAWFNNIIYVWPLPNITTKITVQYYASNETVAANDFLKYLPYHYQPYLIWYAFSKALFRRGKHAQALQYMSYFDNFVDYHRLNDNLNIGVDSKDMMDLPDRTELVG